jgi:ankyrin repeat protein
MFKDAAINMFGHAKNAINTVAQISTEVLDTIKSELNNILNLIKNNRQRYKDNVKKMNNIKVQLQKVVKHLTFCGDDESEYSENYTKLTENLRKLNQEQKKLWDEHEQLQKNQKAPAIENPESKKKLPINKHSGNINNPADILMDAVVTTVILNKIDEQTTVALQQATSQIEEIEKIDKEYQCLLSKCQTLEKMKNEIEADIKKHALLPDGIKEYINFKLSEAVKNDNADLAIILLHSFSPEKYHHHKLMLDMALRNDKVNIMRALLLDVENPINVNHQDVHKNTALHKAIIYGSFKVARLLLGSDMPDEYRRRSANPCIANDDGRFPLHIMAINDCDNDLELFTILLDVTLKSYQPNVQEFFNLRDKHNDTVVNMVVSDNNANYCEILASRGARLRPEGVEWHDTSLFQALEWGQSKIISLNLEDNLDCVETTYIKSACERDEKKFKDALNKALQSNIENKETFLAHCVFYASVCGNLMVLRYLILEFKLKPDSLNDLDIDLSLEVILMRTADNGHFECIKFLTNHFNCPLTAEILCELPIVNAIRVNNPGMIELIQAQKEFNIKEIAPYNRIPLKRSLLMTWASSALYMKFCYSALNVAIAFENSAKVEEFLKMKADPTLVVEEYSTHRPLSFAIQITKDTELLNDSMRKIIELLLGVIPLREIWRQGNGGRNPWLDVLESGCLALVELFKSKLGLPQIVHPRIMRMMSINEVLVIYKKYFSNQLELFKLLEADKFKQPHNCIERYNNLRENRIKIDNDSFYSVFQENDYIIRDEKGWSIIHHAAKYDDVDLIKSLLFLRIKTLDLNVLTNDGETPLTIATKPNETGQRGEKVIAFIRSQHFAQQDLIAFSFAFFREKARIANEQAEISKNQNYKPQMVPIKNMAV